MEKSHVAQVAEELVKLGCTAEEADSLARETHRALVDSLKSGRTTAGKIAEQIVEQETATAPGAGAAASGADETAALAEVDSANVGGIGPDAMVEAFPQSPPNA